MLGMAVCLHTHNTPVCWHACMHGCFILLQHTQADSHALPFRPTSLPTTHPTLHSTPPPPTEVPLVMHYGLIYKIGDWEFDKHWYFDFDVHKCPPWDLKGKPKAGLFPPPPYPDKLPNKVLCGVCLDGLCTVQQKEGGGVVSTRTSNIAERHSQCSHTHLRCVLPPCAAVLLPARPPPPHTHSGLPVSVP